MNINKEAVENNSLFKFLKKYWIPILAVIVTIAVEYIRKKFCI